MKEISVEVITAEVARLCSLAACDLPGDVEAALQKARETEESALGAFALDEICSNIRIARDSRLPLCQDTGLMVVFAEVGQDVHIVGGSFEQAINDGVAQGYVQSYLRASMVVDPVLDRTNTNDNTPAVIHTTIVEGANLTLTVLPKGGGSENMTSLHMLKPAEGLEGVVEAVVGAVVKAGGNPCPPTIVGVGIGGNAEQALLLSKQALRRPVGQHSTHPGYAALEDTLLTRINESGIGPQGFGGRTTALAVHVETFPTHIAMLPVAVTLQCHAARHQTVVL